SYFFWNSTPDAELLTAGKMGALAKPDGVRAQAARLLASDRAKSGIGSFGAELFDLSDLAVTSKPDMRFTPTLRDTMAAELTKLFEATLRPGVDVLDLIDGNRAFVNGELATVYGITGVTGTAVVESTQPAKTPRVGVLGTAAFL